MVFADLLSESTWTTIGELILLIVGVPLGIFLVALLIMLVKEVMDG